jgi:cyclopropane-fatty-acyl-phospholipid synthase
MPSLLAHEMRRLAALTRTPFAVKFADGAHFQTPQGPPAFTLVFRTLGAELATATFGHVGLLDAYFDGDVDIEGDLRAMFSLGSESKFGDENPLVIARNHWHERAHSNASREQAQDNARFHYGLGASFYRLWLDEPRMMYTCAYWKDGTQTLEQAQANKVEHVCRKARLARGDAVVDVGCGFGGFMFDAAARHSVRVTGINNTTEQVEWLDAEIRARECSDQLNVVQADFRDIPGQYDKVISIGVLEHAGRDQLADVVNAHARALKPGGLGVLHFIGHVGRRDTEFFIRDHVFPGGWIPSLAETIVAMEDAGLEIVDIENLRRHYALTLDVWAERFERSWPRIRDLDPHRFDERFRRVWMTYLVGCAEMFRSPAERTHLFQIVFSKGNVASAGYPMSRAFLYADEGAAVT